MTIKIKSLMMAMTMAATVATLAACDDDDNNADEATATTAAFQTANRQFVAETVIPTYVALADHCMLLETALNAADTDEACAEWFKARQYWEWSEAFLFGAATTYGIDPHIDTWPVDVTVLNSLLGNLSILDDPSQISTISNSGLLGFHGLEYILFRDGTRRTDIPDGEMAYAQAVAHDLTISACRLEAAWGGIEAIAADKRALLEEEEMEPGDNFGEYMINAGQPGSTYRTVADGTLDILGGARSIIDEVAHTKIGKPYTGEDITYIESPHSYNSIQDFYDNIVSCRNSYYGGLGATTPQAGSLAAYFAAEFPADHAAVVAALEASLAAIDAMERPFVQNYNTAAVAAAIATLETLDTAFGRLENDVKR